MAQIKLYVLAAIALIATIVALQNTQSVDTRILFFTITAPRVILLLVTFLLGVLTGVLATLNWRRSTGRKVQD